MTDHTTTADTPMSATLDRLVTALTTVDWPRTIAADEARAEIGACVRELHAGVARLALTNPEK